MRITESFIKEILISAYPHNYQTIYDKSLMLQYIDKKTKAVHGNSKTRRSLANLYSIYSILYFYEREYYQKPDEYRKFQGYEYMRLFAFYRGLYGGSKLQNHALNSRVNGEFRNKFQDAQYDLIIINDGKYLIHIDYLYIDGNDISKVTCRIIEKYIDLFISKDHALISILEQMTKIVNYSEKKQKINELLSEDAEARIFEIISYVF